MKTVFFNNLPILLVTDLKHKSENHFYYINKVNVLNIIIENDRDLTDKIYFYNDNDSILQQQFLNYFKVIEAAGGKVSNEKNEILFIYRNDKWDLPKGKVEKKETIQKAAIREVEEETGIENLKIDKPLETTYHIYEHKKKYVLKISYWFEMKSDFKGELLPQLEEGITEVAWLSKSKIEKALKNTYENIKLLF